MKKSKKGLNLWIKTVRIAMQKRTISRKAGEREWIIAMHMGEVFAQNGKCESRNIRSAEESLFFACLFFCAVYKKREFLFLS